MGWNVGFSYPEEGWGVWLGALDGEKVPKGYLN